MYVYVRCFGFGVVYCFCFYLLPPVRPPLCLVLSLMCKSCTLPVAHMRPAALSSCQSCSQALKSVVLSSVKPFCTRL